MWPALAMLDSTSVYHVCHVSSRVVYVQYDGPYLSGGPGAAVQLEQVAEAVATGMLDSLAVLAAALPGSEEAVALAAKAVAFATEVRQLQHAVHRLYSSFECRATDMFMCMVHRHCYCL